MILGEKGYNFIMNACRKFIKTSKREEQYLKYLSGDILTREQTIKLLNNYKNVPFGEIFIDKKNRDNMILMQLPDNVIELFKQHNVYHSDKEIFFAFPYVIKSYCEDVYELIPYNELSDELLVNLLNMPDKNERTNND